MTGHKKNHADEHGSGQDDDIHAYVDHGTIQGLGDDDHLQYLKTDGTRALTGDQDFGGNKGTGAADPGSPTDLATKGYVDSVAVGLDWQDSVIDFYDPTSALPPTPSTGDRYIASATGNGWTIDRIYEYNGSTWDETIPNEGFALRNETDNLAYTYNGTAWVNLGEAVDHGALQGLGDDDHTQYSKVDGTRAFTGTVGGVTPVANADLATKGYTDAEHKKPPYVSQAAEPAVTAGEQLVWHDSTNTKWWYIFGTDGTVGGNKKVQLS